MDFLLAECSTVLIKQGGANCLGLVSCILREGILAHIGYRLAIPDLILYFFLPRTLDIKEPLNIFSHLLYSLPS